MSLRRMRRAVREGRYRFTAHALAEMDEDDLTELDVRQVILRGDLVARLTDDPRGIRFVVRAFMKEKNIEVDVVCRFVPAGSLRILTVYAVGMSRR